MSIDSLRILHILGAADDDAMRRHGRILRVFLSGVK